MFVPIGRDAQDLEHSVRWRTNSFEPDIRVRFSIEEPTKVLLTARGQAGVKPKCQTETLMNPVETLAAVQRLLSDYVESNTSSAPHQWGNTEARAVMDNRTDEMRTLQGNEKSIGTKAVSAGRGLEMPTASEVHYRIHLRDLRHEHFKSDLMSDPVWGILLELLLGQIEYRQISIKSATIASRVPPTTAHRHIRRLEERGLLRRYPDVFDRRRTLLALTDHGLRAIAALFAESRGIALKPYGPARLSLLPPRTALESNQAQ